MRESTTYKVTGLNLILKLWWDDYDIRYRLNQDNLIGMVELLRRLVNVEDANGDGDASATSSNFATPLEEGPFVRLVDAMPFLHMLFVLSPYDARVQWLCATRVKKLLQADSNACRNLVKDERWTVWFVEMLLISGDNMFTSPDANTTALDEQLDSELFTSKMSETPGLHEQNAVLLKAEVPQPDAHHLIVL